MRRTKRPALAGTRILITAGPTVEPIDPVRFISNRSSGRLGYALARVARDRGARVTLVSGPTALPPPHGVRFVGITTARQMHRVCLRAAMRADLILMCAAVADYRPRATLRHKIKKHGTRTLRLTLVPNPDILADLGRRKRRGQVLVGFALETRGLLRHARKKLRAKRCDLIVANTADAIAGTHQRAVLLTPHHTTHLPPLTKTALARRILRAAQELMG